MIWCGINWVIHSEITQYCDPQIATLHNIIIVTDCTEHEHLVRSSTLVRLVDGSGKNRWIHFSEWTQTFSAVGPAQLISSRVKGRSHDTQKYPTNKCRYLAHTLPSPHRLSGVWRWDRTNSPDRQTRLSAGTWVLNETAHHWQIRGPCQIKHGSVEGWGTDKNPMSI